MNNAKYLYQCFFEAFKYFAQKEGYGGKTAIAHGAGVSNGLVSDILNQKKKAGFETQVAIANAIGYNYTDFLDFGQGILEKRSDLKEPNVSTPPFPEKPLVIDVVNGFEKINLEDHLEHYRGIPLYESGKLAAKVGGYSFNDNEKPDSTVVVYQPELQGRVKHDLRALRVGGDSMWPKIPEGSIVVVDLNDREFVEDKIYVVREPFSDPPIASVKRIRKATQKKFQGFALISENPKYLPEMTDFDWHEIVVGRAVWMWRSLEEA